ncbi:hypothetical protein OGR47_10045 [Methylocystis sp. MJC1]|jgi:hypothetical protein|nr:hypothetical protein [Methylocystis sp. MJC1]KAF2992186.1 hypothetical protein MJC1_00562 [Methylocystis sp. MJC1]MBU6527327.1 hypothetical protein [Methylocystis sp. MJC1]UZX10278.1 hypothetical protein OGR47_10045 [Methylocystis sp. MJC1]
MRKTTSTDRDKRLPYDWKADLIAVFLAALVAIPVVAEWFYWTHSQLGR